MKKKRLTKTDQIKLLERKLKHRERVIVYLSNKLKAQEHQWQVGERRSYAEKVG